MYRNLQCMWNSQVSRNPRYKCTTTKTMYVFGDYSSLPLLLEKEEERSWTILNGRQEISGVSQAYFSSFKGFYQCRYYCKECLCSQTGLKAWDSEEKLAFLLILPLRHHIAQFGTFSVSPGIFLSLRRVHMDTTKRIKCAFNPVCKCSHKST